MFRESHLGATKAQAPQAGHAENQNRTNRKCRPWTILLSCVAMTAAASPIKPLVSWSTYLRGSGLR